MSEAEAFITVRLGLSGNLLCDSGDSGARLAKLRFFRSNRFPTDELLWQTLPGVINSAGNLALHIEGNLSEFVGRQLGGLPYQETEILNSVRRKARVPTSARASRN